ncbi:hypothetical protein [uncultured Microbacterium sp.]|uniref:glycosyl hydrolase 2 galactose-binding domain-containing protein n=1 Tax=uncultured Microbacterium sp. TaxID=191216 RepID=UPI0035CC1CE8
MTWQLEGWRPWEWALVPFEAKKGLGPDVGPVPARIPGSVRGALLAAGLLPDPYVQDNSLAGEFIEHRHWIFRTDLSSYLDRADDELQLDLDVIDGPCIVRWRGQQVARHENAFVPLSVRLPAAERADGAVLELIFLETPPGLSQIGRSSTIRALKPRFSSGWDWIPRLAHIGVANVARVVSRRRPRIVGIGADAAPRTGGGGEVEVSVTVDGGEGCDVVVRISGPDGASLATRTLHATGDESTADVRFEFDSVDLWSLDHPALYHVSVTVQDGEPGHDTAERAFGFRSIRWEHTVSAAAGAEPWIAILNEKTLFLAGVNWVPIRADFSDVPDEVYGERLRLYRDLGFNTVRVWGGAARERDIFYDLCDSLGMLVWQDLPLSSSGLDNYPPDDGAFSRDFGAIAASYRTRLSHHPSLIVWASGNELSGSPELKVQPGAPLDFAHPALAAARSVLEDQSRWKVVAATPSGPSYSAEEAEYGHGLHHDVHGPWAHEGDLDSWRRYWHSDDAMLRSEVGIAGASPHDLLVSSGLLPLDERRRLTLWRHSSKWWLNGTEQPTPEWMAESQARQAELLALAMQATLDRFPSCAGFFVWMGHDAFPCAVSLSIVDFWGRPKPAAIAIGRVLSEYRPLLGREMSN